VSQKQKYAVCSNFKGEVCISRDLRISETKGEILRPPENSVPQTIGKILRPPENSVLQTIVFRYKEIVDKLCGNIEKKVLFLSQYSLDRNNSIASLFRTYTHTNNIPPDFLIAEYFGLRNTIFWVTKDLALFLK
jgi:hypothetical protein